MVSTFSNVYQTTPVESIKPRTKTGQKEPSKSCEYWLKQIFCCKCFCKKSKSLPQAPEHRPQSEPDREVPSLSLKKIARISEVTVEIMGVPTRPDLSIAVRPSQPTSAIPELTFSLDAQAIHVNFSISSGLEGEKSVRVGRSLFQRAESAESTQESLGIFSIIGNGSSVKPVAQA